VRQLADWILVIPVPDPELQCELIGWAMILMWLADRMMRWSGMDGYFRKRRQAEFPPANDGDR
jgi:hypothetical protein